MGIDRHKLRKVKTVVAEQNENSSNNEYVTPPSSPVARRVSLHQSRTILPRNVQHRKILLQAELQEDESGQSILEARATLEDSRLF